MKLIWVVIPLVLIGIIGIQESLADESTFSLKSPKQQTDAGVLPHEVECRGGLVAIFKANDNTPGCVHIISSYKLFQRGWSPHPIISENHYVTLTTDKSEYKLGEPIIIRLKNIGTSVATFSNGAYGIGIFFNNEFICCASTDARVQLDSNVEITYTWNQYGIDSDIIAGNYEINTSYGVPEGKGELGLPITIVNERVVSGDAANVKLSTDKPRYTIYENIIITMENVGNSDAHYPGIPVGFWITDEYGDVVLSTQGNAEAVGWLKSGESKIYEWNQINEFTKKSVNPGKFTITTDWDNLKTNHFFIIDSPPDFEE